MGIAKDKRKTERQISRHTDRKPRDGQQESQTWTCRYTETKTMEEKEKDNGKGLYQGDHDG